MKPGYVLHPDMLISCFIDYICPQQSRGYTGTAVVSWVQPSQVQFVCIVTPLPSAAQGEAGHPEHTVAMCQPNGTRTGALTTPHALPCYAVPALSAPSLACPAEAEDAMQQLCVGKAGGGKNTALAVQYCCLPPAHHMLSGASAAFHQRDCHCLLWVGQSHSLVALRRQGCAGEHVRPKCQTPRHGAAATGCEALRPFTTCSRAMHASPHTLSAHCPARAMCPAFRRGAAAHCICACSLFPCRALLLCCVFFLPQRCCRT